MGVEEDLEEGEYRVVMGGKLPLKGGLKLSKDKKHKSKKKKSKKKKNKKSRDSDVRSGEDFSENRSNGSRQSNSRKRLRDESEDNKEDSTSNLTPAQKKFLEVQKKREKDLVARLVEKTHRERINEFNEKLASLSEHHDVPKVGNAGMG